MRTAIIICIILLMACGATELAGKIALWAVKFMFWVFAIGMVFVLISQNT